jgi:hypothetical protein
MANDTLAIHSFSDIESTYEKYLQGLRILTEGAKAETGQTPKEVIWTKNKARLYHYEPLREKRFPVPILLIYALINRSYVLDLMPGKCLEGMLMSRQPGMPLPEKLSRPIGKSMVWVTRGQGAILPVPTLTREAQMRRRPCTIFSWLIP